MGSGNKLMPEKLDIMPLAKTAYDPIARRMRRKLNKHPKFEEILVVASTERPRQEEVSKRTPASIAFVPATAGLIAASYVIRKILETT
jgi:tRNA A37 threonylcarbamoyladenosine dehydratase